MLTLAPTAVSLYDAGNQSILSAWLLTSKCATLIVQVGNACGTIGLLHAMYNATQKLTFSMCLILLSLKLATPSYPHEWS